MKLKNLCEITSSKRIFANEYTKEGIPFYRSKEIIELSSGKNPTTELYISDEKYNEIKNKHTVPQENDILLTAVGTIGVSYLVKNSNFYFKDGNLMWFRNIKNNVLPKFLCYYFKSQKFLNEINTIAIGSTQKALTIDKVKEIEIYVPDLVEQQHIVDTIGSIDDLIENLNNTNDKINSLIFEYCKKISFNKNLVTIGDYVVEEKERQGENNFKLLSVISSGAVIEQEDFFDKDTSSKDRKKYKIVNPMHFAFNPARANIGSIGMWNSNYQGCISPIYSVFKVKIGFELFFNFYLKMPCIKEEIIKRSSGSVRQNLPFEEFVSIKFPKLSSLDITEFNNYVIPLWNRFNSNIGKIKLLNLLKSNLLAKFFE